MSHLYDVNKLIAKYGMDNPPDPNNPEAEAVLAGERNDADNWLLCDPVRSPELYEIIAGAYHNLRKLQPERARELGEPEPFAPDSTSNVWEYVGDEGRCCINIANFCNGLVTDLPISFCGLTMVFKCCSKCRAKIAEDTEIGMAISAMEAQSELPPGARIDPGSPVPPRLD